MKFIFSLFLIVLSFNVFALTEEERIERNKILNQFGDKEEFLEKEKREREQAKAQSLAAEEEARKQEELKNNPQARKQEELKNNLQAKQQAVEDYNNRMLEQLNNSENQPPEGMVESDTKDLEELTKGKFQIPAMGNMPKLDPAEMKKIMKNLDANPLFKMMDKKQKQMAASMMKHNPFQDMKKDAIKSSINGMFGPKTQVGKFLKRNPKVVTILSELAVDKKALPSFMSIMNQPKKMQLFGGIVLIVFIVVFLINLRNSSKGILQRIFFKMFIIVGSATINISAFYFIFRKEIGPGIDVILKHI